MADRLDSNGLAYMWAKLKNYISDHIGIAGVRMNGSDLTPDVNKKVDLGTVITAHQDISGKADKVSGATNGHLASLDANGNIGDSGHTVATDVPANAVFTDTTYSDATQSVHGLMSTADKTKLDGIAAGATANTGTVTKVSTGTGLTGGDITSTGTIKANLTSETKFTNAAADATETAGRVYPVRVDKNGHLAVNVPWENTWRPAYSLPLAANGTRGGVQIGYTQSGKNYPVQLSSEKMYVNVPWENTTYSSKSAASGGTDVSLVTTGEKYTWNSKTSNTGTVTKVSTGAGLTGGDVTTTGTIKANLANETKLSDAGSSVSNGRPYEVRVDKNGKLVALVEWATTSVGGIITGAEKASYEAKVNRSGDTMTGNLTMKDTGVDASKANNGVSSTHYPTTNSIQDNSNRILTRNEAIISSDGNIAAYWYVRNYNTSGGQVAQKGIQMTMNKSGNVTYSVGDPANFRSAIGAGTISKVQANGTDVASSGTANIPAASTSAYGVTKLYNGLDSTSTALALTAAQGAALYGRFQSWTGGTKSLVSTGETWICGGQQVSSSSAASALGGLAIFSRVGSNYRLTPIYKPSGVEFVYNGNGVFGVQVNGAYTDVKMFAIKVAG